MKAPATGTLATPIKTGAALRYSINQTLDLTGSTRHDWPP
jgi:hypothetical protein